MLIVGAGGFARELIDVVLEQYSMEEIAFFDDVNSITNLYGCRVLKTENEVKEWFSLHGSQYCLGIGTPHLRQKMAAKFTDLGGALTSIISQNAFVGKVNVDIADGATILHHATIANGVKIGKGALIYHKVQITHDCRIGEFCEFSPGATLLGKVELGNHVSCGANATILPKLKIADEVIIGAGAVVTRSILNKSIVKGIPAK